MISTWEHLLKSLVSIVLFRYNLLHYVVVIVSQVYTISNYTYGNEIIENLEFIFSELVVGCGEQDINQK